MTETLVQAVIDFFGGSVGKEALVFIISMKKVWEKGVVFMEESYEKYFFDVSFCFFFVFYFFRLRNDR